MARDMTMFGPFVIPHMSNIGYFDIYVNFWKYVGVYGAFESLCGYMSVYSLPIPSILPRLARSSAAIPRALFFSCSHFRIVSERRCLQDAKAFGAAVPQDATVISG